MNKLFPSLRQLALRACALAAASASIGATQALPLLGETAGAINVTKGILTLYRDHQNQNLFYFFPNSTRFSLDNKRIPLFNFAYWGVDQSPMSQDAGGYLTMSTHLASDDDQQTALNNWMRANPGKEVAVLPIVSSVVALQTTQKDATPLSKLFTEYNFSRVGGRAEDEIGVNATLTGRGAKVFKNMLLKDAGGQFVKFDYCYKIQGLGPNMDAEIKVNMKRVYDYFEASSSGGWMWFSASIKTAIEKLQKENAVSITMNGGDAKEWEVLDKVAQTVTTRLFTPEVKMVGVSPAETNNLFNFNAAYTHREELGEETWTWKRQDLETREFCTAVSVKDLSGYLGQLVTSGD